MRSPQTHRNLTPRGKRILYPIFILAIVNFIAFFIGAVHLGGDALNGHVADGHYFLSSHGVHTEVSRAVWRYSYFHAASVFLTHGLTVLTAAILFATGDLKK